MERLKAEPKYHNHELVFCGKESRVAKIDQALRPQAHLRDAVACSRRKQEGGKRAARVFERCYYAGHLFARPAFNAEGGI